ncbi:hypothetical protein A2Y99_04470 [Candidatus Gottesmanbacteria bacterium RBG_13_37_7]|uniref:Carbonic anhydrase n=1 Tax=Candidatus Gottesmanbacteria bacterium RBG_13_37_7 TaxID=1798369 RepID=A0A1F5YHF6_9BACT|nr:MAG: hypothetical protein A2Y99_04470 [Candidatus Gottesmanbacteria bacterium RBG_13_37_7]
MTKLIHSCQAIVVTCIDFRFQDRIQKWIKNHIKNGFDRVAVAGGVKNPDFVLSQIEISVRLHHTKEVYLINHEDCGAYGKEGNFEKHKQDLLATKEKIAEKHPFLKVYLLYLKLSGEFVTIKNN